MIWVIVYTAPAKDAFANSFVRYQLNFRTLFLRTRIKCGRVEGIGPLFPRYLFVGLRSLSEAGPLNRAEGVQKVLKSADAPLTVPEGVIEGLKARRGPDGLVPLTPSLEAAKRELYAAGERVRINGELFQGRLATVVLDKGAQIQVDIKGTRLFAPEEAVSPVLRDASLS